MKTSDLPKEVLRFNLHFRVQHVVLFSTFLLLAFTGWGLKYKDVDASYWLVRAFGGAENAGLIHRIAGVTMICDFLYHLTYMSYLVLTGRLKLRKETTILPIPKDVLDVYQNFKYFLGLTREKPRFMRFTYAQKFDYWAVFWGMAIIGISGLALAFPVTASSLVPEFASAWFWQLLMVLHSDEALLAVVFILFWHFYNEHLKPAVFPMSWVWLTGMISIDELREKHREEYDMMIKELEARREQK